VMEEVVETEVRRQVHAEARWGVVVRVRVVERAGVATETDG
jgi:hypothetical protein